MVFELQEAAVEFQRSLGNGLTMAWNIIFSGLHVELCTRKCHQSYRGRIWLLKRIPGHNNLRRHPSWLFRYHNLDIKIVRDGCELLTVCFLVLHRFGFLSFECMLDVPSDIDWLLSDLSWHPLSFRSTNSSHLGHLGDQACHLLRRRHPQSWSLLECSNVFLTKRPAAPVWAFWYEFFYSIY